MEFKSKHSKDLNLHHPSKNTEILYNEIKEATNIYTFLEENSQSFQMVSFPSYFELLLKKKNIKKVELLYQTGLSRSFIYALLKGDRSPSRDTVLIMAVTIGASLEETFRLLKSANHQPLYAKDQRDTIIIFGIKQKMSLNGINDILYDLNINILGL